MAGILSVVSATGPAQTETSFTRITVGPAVNDPAHGVGCAWIDYDNDNFVDLFITSGFNILASDNTNRLYRNSGDGTFTRATTNEVGRVVSDDWGRLVSETARLTVLLKPCITRLATNYTVVRGGTVILSVECTGTLPMSYRWRRNFTNLKLERLDARQSFLVLSNVQPDIGGPSNPYTVILTNEVFSQPGLLSSNIYLTVLPDTDADGMDDTWETEHGLNPGDPSDAASDADLDRMTNKQEYQSGTDPTNSTSYLKVERIAVSGEARIEFIAAANLTYTVEYKTRRRGDAETISWRTTCGSTLRRGSRTMFAFEQEIAEHAERLGVLCGWSRRPPRPPVKTGSGSISPEGWNQQAPGQ
jgi:hypothetical protein